MEPEPTLTGMGAWVSLTLVTLGEKHLSSGGGGIKNMPLIKGKVLFNPYAAIPHKCLCGNSPDWQCAMGQQCCGQLWV